MHEFHLMVQVVKAVETGLERAPGAKPTVVRLKVNVCSHLLADDRSSLHTAFDLAVRGTVVEGAALEIIPVSGESRCLRCPPAAGQRDERGDPIAGAEGTCPNCGGEMVAGEEEPEVVVHEVVVEE